MRLLPDVGSAVTIRVHIGLALSDDDVFFPLGIARIAKPGHAVAYHVIVKREATNCLGSDDAQCQCCRFAGAGPVWAASA